MGFDEKSIDETNWKLELIKCTAKFNETTIDAYYQFN